LKRNFLNAFPPFQLFICFSLFRAFSKVLKFSM